MAAVGATLTSEVPAPAEGSVGGKEAVMPGARSAHRLELRGVVPAILASLALLAAACGGSGDAGTSDASTSATVVSVTTTPSSTTGEAVATTVAATTSTDAAPTTSTTPTEAFTVEDLARGVAAWIEHEHPALGPGRVDCDSEGTLHDWQPVHCTFSPDEPAEAPQIYVSVLDGGRYAPALGECCGGSPHPTDYPAGLRCRDLAAPPPDGPSFEPGSDHLTYGLAVYYWLTEGRPGRMDADLDGRPCGSVYPAAEVDTFWDAAIELDGRP